MNPTSQVIIDRRPLWLLMVVRGYRYLMIAGLSWLAVVMWQNPVPEGLTLAGWHAIILFIACIILWVFQLLPLAITGLLAIAAQPLMGVASHAEAYANFGHPTVFFLVGVFILAAAFMKTGLSTRIALLLLRGAGHHPSRLILQIMLASAIMSFFMSEHAVAAMMFPIVLEFARALAFIPYGGSYGRLLFLGMAWGCVVGGVGTLLGGGRAPLAIGFLEEYTGQTISFIKYSWMVWPIVLVMFPVIYFLLTRYFSIDVDSVESVNRHLQKRLETLGKVRFPESVIVFVFGLCVIGWMVIGHQVGMATVAILGVIVLFVLNIFRWADLEEYVNWGIILLYGGAIALGTALHRTGAGAWVVHHYLIPHISDPFFLVIAFGVIAIFLTELISNSAVVATLLPIALSLGGDFGIDPRALVYLIAVASGLAYGLPMSTPAMAIAFSSGYYNLRQIAIPVLLLHLVSLLVMFLVAWLWWPLFGVRAF